MLSLGRRNLHRQVLLVNQKINQRSFPNVCGFRERPSGAMSFAVSRKCKVVPTETDDFRHEIYQKNKKIKLKKPEEFAIASFNMEEERHKSLNEIIK